MSKDKKPKRKPQDLGNYSLARSVTSKGFYKYPNALQIAWHMANGTWPALVDQPKALPHKHGYLFGKDITRALKHQEKIRT